MPERARGWLDADDAADYVGLRREPFLARVKAGKMPAPSHALGPASPRRGGGGYGRDGD